MKILVTGAMGQVGAELIQQGLNRGYEMLATDIDDLDITNQEAVNAYVADHKPNLIINAAAYTAVDKAESESELAFSINCDGAKHLAIACNEASIPLFQDKYLNGFSRTGEKRAILKFSCGKSFIPWSCPCVLFFGHVLNTRSKCSE